MDERVHEWLRDYLAMMEATVGFGLGYSPHLEELRRGTLDRIFEVRTYLTQSAHSASGEPK